MGKKKILFVNDEMRMGGVARVLNSLMRNLPRDKYEIDLLVLHKEGMLLNEVPNDVHVYEGSKFFETVDLSLDRLIKEKDYPKIASKLRLLFYMKTGLIKKKIMEERKRILDKQYDVEVAAKEGFCTIFTAYGDSKRKINWVLTDYSVKNYSVNHMSLVKQALQQIDLNIADSKQALVAYETVFRVQNGVTIHNLMEDSILEKGNRKEDCEIKDSDVPNVITVARFHPQKSIDRLLIASQNAKERGYAHHLYLVGGGELESELKEYAEVYQMEHVHFLGYKQNPYADMKKADLFVLSSLYEGFATVVSESLMLTTPVLTTRVSGCEEQITSPDYGWIVENTQEALNQGLIEALSNPARLKEQKEALKHHHYDNEAIIEEFVKVL
ncbi:MAG: glycosyltransferase [Solobacterium sp.]|nr:glycosyltransferase [Solobacterium sp.]